MNDKKRMILKKLVALHNDSYDRWDENDCEWMACRKQGKNIIQKELGDIEQAKLIASNIFSLFCNKQLWFAHPTKDARSEDFPMLLENALRKLGISYSSRDYGYGGKKITLN